jgi:hypothetical protein
VPALGFHNSDFAVLSVSKFQTTVGSLSISLDNFQRKRHEIETHVSRLIVGLLVDSDSICLLIVGSL